MRPGLLCPGSAVGDLAGGLAHPASMRPGLLCPGRRFGDATAVAIMRGFNEAGAVMPRKMPGHAVSPPTP